MNKFSHFSTGVSDKVRGRVTSEDPVYKSPTPPRSILAPRLQKAVGSPSPLSVDSGVSDEVFVPVTHKPGVNGTELVIEAAESESLSEDSNTNPVPYRTGIEPPPSVQPSREHTVQPQSGELQRDYYTEQYYSVTSPSGPTGGLQVRRFKLEPDHSHHREKVNKHRFDRLKESLQSKLSSAESSLQSSSRFLNSKDKPEKQEDNHSNTTTELSCGDYHRRPKVRSNTTLNRGKLSNRLGDTRYSNSNSSEGLSNKQSGRFTGDPCVQTHTVEKEKVLEGSGRTSFWEKMSESTLAEPRLHEKQELQTLNTRLSQYIRHMRELKENAGYLDSQVFLESVTVLEEELNNLKNMYEKELDNARIQIDDITRSKSHYELEEKKAKSLASELKNRLEVEAGRTQKLQVEVNSLQRLLAQKDMQIEEGRIAIQTPLSDLETLQHEYNKMRRDHEELRKRFDKEQLARQDAEDRSDTMRKKMDFQTLINEQEKKELNDRLTSANGTILALEERVREMSHHDKTLVEMLKRVRESAEEELRKYQEEAEERHNRHLTELKAQIDEDDQRIVELTDEHLKLNADITAYLGKIRELEGQVGSLDHQKTCLLEQLNSEKQRAQNHMKKMEFKLRELQDVLINKMRELNAARDSQIPLKAEIESFKSMIEEEERRLRIGPGEFPELPVLPQSYGKRVAFTPASTANSPLVMPKSEGYGVKSVVPNVRGYEEGQASPRPLGPIRVKSAPAAAIRQKHQQPMNMIPSNLGQGRDYFDEMFRDLKISDSQRLTPNSADRVTPVYSHTPSPCPQSPDVLKVHDSPPVVPSPPLHPKSPSPAGGMEQGRPATVTSCMARPTSSSLERVQQPSTSCVSENWVHKRIVDQDKIKGDEETLGSGAVGDLKIQEVNPEGRYIRVMNSSNAKDEELGGHVIQQNVGGHPVAVYRFPNKLKCGANEVVTVWSGANDYGLHQPPSDFVFKEQQKWGTGPECTTILCKPNGQAVAWTTAAQRYSRDLYNEMSVHNSPAPPSGGETMQRAEYDEGNTNNNNGDLPEMTTQQETLAEYNMNINGQQTEPLYLRREQENPPSLNAPKHPHGASPPDPSHPSTGQARALTYGNDNSSVNRQTRIQNPRPDPVPGAPYAGASAQRMGAAALRRFQPTSTPNKAVAVTSSPPNSFQKPRDRFQAGLEQVQSQHHADFQPPMPRPPMFSAW